MDGMGILDNLENAWDEEFHFESCFLGRYRKAK
jgi:hypothetical protein